MIIRCSVQVPQLHFPHFGQTRSGALGELYSSPDKFKIKCKGITTVLKALTQWTNFPS